MFPTSLLALTASLIIPLIAASSIPICEPSTQVYATSDITTLYKDFCGVLEKNNFTSDVQLYGAFIVSFGFISANSSNVCDLNNCLSSYFSLVQSCQLNSHEIYGTASLDAGCGVYNFTILDTVPSSTVPSISTLIPPPWRAANISSSTDSSSIATPTTSGSATETSKASTTKPSVGSTALGTSDAGAGIRKVSVFTLALVGCIFVFFL